MAFGAASFFLLVCVTTEALPLSNLYKTRCAELNQLLTVQDKYVDITPLTHIPQRDNLIESMENMLATSISALLLRPSPCVLLLFSLAIFQLF